MTPNLLTLFFGGCGPEGCKPKDKKRKEKPEPMMSLSEFKETQKYTLEGPQEHDIAYEQYRSNWLRRNKEYEQEQSQMEEDETYRRSQERKQELDALEIPSLPTSMQKEDFNSPRFNSKILREVNDRLTEGYQNALQKGNKKLAEKLKKEIEENKKLNTKQLFNKYPDIIDKYPEAVQLVR